MDPSASLNGQQARIAVIVISLSAAEGRRKIVEEYLSRLGLPWRFFDALVYPSERTAHHLPVEGKLSNSEVGCFLSHMSVWCEVRDMDVDYAIVLEDDTVLLPNIEFGSLFLLLRELGIDIIRLSALRIDRAVPLAHFEPLYGYLCRIIAPKHNLGTGCYAITPRAAHTLFSAVKKINQPADHWLETFWNHKVPIYNIFPSPAVEFSSKSTILHSPRHRSASLFEYLSSKTRILFMNFVEERLLSKLDYALRKRIERTHPGMAAWPRAELRKHLRMLYSRSAA